MKRLALLLLLCLAASWRADAAKDSRFRRGMEPSESSSSSGSSHSSDSGSGRDSSSSSLAAPPVPPASQLHSSHSQRHSHESSEESSEAYRQELIRNMHMVAQGDDSTKDQELAEALQTVKDQIVTKANEIKAEKKWVREVTKIIEAYVKKTRRVNGNIRKLQNEVKVLFRKKKQIENMIVQRKLEKKLKVALTDLNTINLALKNVKIKESAFNKSKKSIKETINAMQTALKKLRGQYHGSENSNSNSSSSDNSEESSSSSSS
jgi:valyl-tRNA synthetase